jgi:hypothetical protein
LRVVRELIIEMLLLELEHSDALLPIRLGFCGAFGVDGAFGEEIGAAACDDERAPAVAMAYC